MARLRESWRSVVVTTASPNGAITLRNHGDAELRFAVDPGWLQRTDLTTFTAQLVRLFRLAFVDRTRAYNRSKELATGIAVGPIEANGDPHVAEFLDRRDSMVVQGASWDGSVSVVGVGMTRFTVEISADAWARRDHAALERALGEAATAALREQFRLMQELKREGH